MTDIIRPQGHLGGKTPESQFFAIATLLGGIPTEGVVDVEAIAAWPGIMLDAAVKHAASYWNGGSGRHFLVAGYHDAVPAEEIFGSRYLCNNYGLVRTRNIHTQVHARHAGEQAEWLADKVVELGIESLALSIPNFHMARGYLTTIESLRRRGVMIPIIPIIPRVSPFEHCVLNAAPGGARDKCELDVIHAEANPRMMNYQKAKADGSPGDVATDEFFYDYLKWLYEQQVVADYVMKGTP